MSAASPKPDRVLVIDDDPSMVTIVQSLVDLGTKNVIAALTLTEGIKVASEQRFDVVLLDHRLPDGDGLDRIDDLILQDRLRPVLYITAQSGSHTAIEAIKRGAFDYLSKPFDFALLKQRLGEALEYRKLTRIPVMVDVNDGQPTESDVLVGRCRAMQEVYKSIGRLAALSKLVLVEGEVGTGKEMIARTIHNHGSRKGKPFIKLSTGDFNELAMQHELFGNDTFDRIEPSFRLRECEGGTLMIEEVGGLSLPLQSRLLRFLQQLPIDLSVVCSTSMLSRELVQRGSLRSDLFYFLSPYTIRVPALRERIEDLELLVGHFMQGLLRVSSAVQDTGPPRVSQSAMSLLRAYDWPVNIAQLKSVLQSVLLESRGAILATDALHRALDTSVHPKPAAVSQSIQPPSIDGDWDLAAFANEQLKQGTDCLYEMTIQKLDQQLVMMVLKHTQGNQAQAARLLGMTRTSLRRKIASANIRLSDFGPAGAIDDGEREPSSSAAEDFITGE